MLSILHVVNQKEKLKEKMFAKYTTHTIPLDRGGISHRNNVKVSDLNVV